MSSSKIAVFSWEFGKFKKIALEIEKSGDWAHFFPKKLLLSTWTWNFNDGLESYLFKKGALMKTQFLDESLGNCEKFPENKKMLLF